MTRIKDLPTFETLDPTNWIAVDSNDDLEPSGKASPSTLAEFVNSDLAPLLSIVEGTGITVSGDPQNPTITADQGGGDMYSAIYDPQNISNDAFDLAVHTGELPPSSVNELTLTRRLSARVGGLFDTVSDLLADTTLTYSNVSPGDIIEAQGFRYEVVTSDTTGADIIETSGGVKLRVLPDVTGAFNVGAWGPASGDQTGLVIAAGISAGPIGVVRVPFGVEFDPIAALADPEWPLQVFLLDESFRAQGYENTRTHGFYAKGDPTAVKDIITVLAHDGHNPSVSMSNDGSSGSHSGNARVITRLWNGGFFDKGGLPGFPRTFAIEQFDNRPDQDRWNYTIRKRAPSKAIDALYFRWAEGVDVAIGEVCFSNNNYYEAISAGVTGGSAPSHTSGSSSDGGVTWEYIPFGYDGTVFTVDDLGHISVNGGLSSGNFQQWNMDNNDSLASMPIAYIAAGPSKSVILRLQPTNANGNPINGWNLTASDQNLLFIRGSGILGGFDEDGFQQRGLTRFARNVSNGDTTPSVTGTSRLNINNSSATSITNLDDGATNQEVQLIFFNGNTTMINSSDLRLEGGTNVTPSAGSVITLSRWTGGSGWIEVSRSIK